MKEKITLFIALSFLVGLTVYKKSYDTTVELADNALINMEQNPILDNTNDAGNNLEYNDKDSLICNSNQKNTDELQFSEAFKYYRDCNHDTFIWNGEEYTTILKVEINDELEKKHTSLDLVVK